MYNHNLQEKTPTILPLACVRRLNMRPRAVPQELADSMIGDAQKLVGADWLPPTHGFALTFRLVQSLAQRVRPLA